ncbi:Hypp3784 [Branchiostoma lanceolatum]|uniref:Hypp3784 protein n=1 Tax=Branchiostoma lanceolatum TaxID=7740 RepID=A0A8K0A2N7_BRALA|nr:Hypp3784 [Branchiostoma lanceolatum]
MKAVESGTFSAVPSLQALIMSKNTAIKEIGGWFGGNTRLLKLYLSSNEIEQIKKNRGSAAIGTTRPLGENDRRRVKGDDAMSVTYTARVSRQDHGATLVCEVFWENQQEIRWLDPGGRAVGERESLDPCGGAVTTRLEHEFPTAQSPDRETAHSADDTGLPYIGKSTSNLRMSQQAHVPVLDGGQFPNGKMTEGTDKTTERNPQEDGITPTGDELHRDTVMTTTYTTTYFRQNRKMTESIATTTDRNPQPGTTPAGDELRDRDTVMIVVYSTGACPAFFCLLSVITFACVKHYKRRQHQHHSIQGNAAGATGVIPLQNNQPPAQLQAPTTANPTSLQNTYDEIHDDTPIAPYAETTRLEHFVYGEGVTGPRGTTSTPDPRQRPGMLTNSSAVSHIQPQGLGTSQVGRVPDPPPRPNRPVNLSDSNNYCPPRTETSQAEKIPDPLPRPDKKPPGTEKTRPDKGIDSNVSSQPQGSEMLEQTPPSGAMSDPHGLGMDEEEEVEGSHIYLDLNGPPRLTGPYSYNCTDQFNTENRRP